MNFCSKILVAFDTNLHFLHNICRLPNGSNRRGIESIIFNVNMEGVLKGSREDVDNVISKVAVHVSGDIPETYCWNRIELHQQATVIFSLYFIHTIL